MDGHLLIELLQTIRARLGGEKWAVRRKLRSMLDMSSINDPETSVALSSYKPVVEKSDKKSNVRGLTDLNVEW